jgi:hypothetical protein
MSEVKYVYPVVMKWWGNVNNERKQDAITCLQLAQQFYKNISNCKEKKMIATSQSIPNGKVFQLCPGNSDYTFGITIDMYGNLDAVKNALNKWEKGNCVTDGTGTVKYKQDVWEYPKDEMK